MSLLYWVVYCSEEETSFKLVRKLVNQYPPSPQTEEILQLAFEIFPTFVNDQIIDYKHGMVYRSHLLHEACYIGKYSGYKCASEMERIQIY